MHRMAVVALIPKRRDQVEVYSPTAQMQCETVHPSSPQLGAQRVPGRLPLIGAAQHVRGRDGAGAPFTMQPAGEHCLRGGG